MSGIAIVAKQNARDTVRKMLDKMIYRGKESKIVEVHGATFGVLWTPPQQDPLRHFNQQDCIVELMSDRALARVETVEGRVVLTRDPLGIVPMYYGWTEDRALVIASEVKGLLEVTTDIHELGPGCCFDGTRQRPYVELALSELSDHSPDAIAHELRQRLENAVAGRIKGDTIGSWLSGGLDSSVIAAIARPHVKTLHTIAAGVAGAPDLGFARQVAEHIESVHHEVIISLEEMIKALPEVIYHLESFDALLVRSSITNYLAAKAASDYVTEVFSGEGGDEFFAGYAYLKTMPRQDLPKELLDIAGRLHNTALQRVDRCASAHGTIAYVPFADPEVFEFALRIPMEYKLRDGVEKWILRRALEGKLPPAVLNRTKAKFWEGAGVGELLANHAASKITDQEFSAARILPNGWRLNTKEELMYYRFFAETFGRLTDLSWMGRTKGAPVAS